jgi:Asp-tRNA(Asn)/Glu-tRNA(Gln) amidotransferase A subunit family amidase
MNPSKIRIGVLKESSHLPCTESVRRSIKEASKCLKELGYEIVDFEFSDEEWTLLRDLFMSMIANGNGPSMLREFNRECEDLLKPL